MRRLLLLFSLTIATGPLYHVCHTSPAGAQKDLDLTTISNNFTCTMLRVLLPNRPNFTDFLVSPFNIQEAVFLLLNAAKNLTYAEIARVFGLPNSPRCLGNINAQFKKFLKLLHANGNETQVNLATALYVQKECPLRNRYIRKMSYYYAAKTEDVDFQNDSPEVTDEINSFVDQETHGQIPELYENSLPPTTRLVLLAVESFHAKWYNNFFKLNNQTSTFHLLPSGSKQVQYMNNYNATKKTGYTVLDSCQVVRILYADTNYSFFVFLPPSGQDPAVCLQSLTAEKIADLYTATDFQQSVNVTMPRFAFNDQFNNLVPDFQKLGVRQAFVDADLGRAIDQRECGSLAVGQMIHKCCIEVTNEGTTASAVTSIGVRSLAMPVLEIEPIQVFINRLFAFAIASSKPPIFLFTGICSNPIYPNP